MVRSTDSAGNRTYAAPVRAEAGDNGTAEPFGVLLRRLRERAGLTQQELAERAGLTPHAVSPLERGTRTRPYPHTVRSLAEAFGASDAERAALIAAVPSRRAVGAAKPAGLVVPPTHLYGREHDIAAIAKLARSGEARLITLTGPGGVGKTRLVAALSEGLAEDYSDGVVQISLAPQVGRLSASCPEVTVLVSSRSPLRVRAEREYAVEPLELPACDAATAD